MFDVFFSASRNTWIDLEEQRSTAEEHGEFIAHLARFYLEKSRGRKSVVNNPRRARFVAAYEICLVTGSSVAPSSSPGRKGPILPFFSSPATVRRKGGSGGGDDDDGGGGGIPRGRG